MGTRGPDFIIPGASKSGTTSLYYYLNEHDNVFIPETKELHFFERNSQYSKGLEYYESHFPEDGYEVTGEVTPSYIYHGILYERASHDAYYWDPTDDAPARLHRAYPDVKLIFTLRNPVTRAYSQYQKNYRQGRERADSFEEAIRAELDGERVPESHPSCWVYRNRYPVHIERWLEFFDRDQMKFLVFENWVENTDSTLNDICSFLDIEPRDSWSRSDEQRNVGGEPRFVTLNRLYQDYVNGTPLGTFLQQTRVTHVLDALNTSEGYPEMSQSARQLLADEFEDDFRDLESMLGVDLELWREELREPAEP